MTRRPECVALIRRVGPVQHAKGGIVTRVVARLDDGHTAWFELSLNGHTRPCEGHAEAFEIVRAALTQGAP
jgi:hypothetical protein